MRNFAIVIAVICVLIIAIAYFNPTQSPLFTGAVNTNPTKDYVDTTVEESLQPDAARVREVAEKKQMK